MLVSLAYPAAGNNTARAPVYLSRTEAGRFIALTGNLRIKEGRYRTRHRIIDKPIYGNDQQVAEWKSLHTQSAIWYEPRSGQGTHYIGVGPPRVIESAGGKLFSLTEAGIGFEVKDISSGMQAPDRYRLAWLCQGENYVIRSDGFAPVQIFDGKVTVGSPGYSQVAKEAARFPNACGPTVYAGGRFYTTLFGRRIYASDSLHQVNQDSAIDLLKFTDQSYDYINVYFAPPADDGDVTALTVSIDSGFDNSRAQGEVITMCENSIWGIALGIDRELWPVTKMRHSRSKETSATGPNAFWVRDGDILMRTARGIESLNLLNRDRAAVGTSVLDLGIQMHEILRRDPEDALLFASLVNPLNLNRMFCTVTPIVEGLRHYHLGWLTANWNPMQEQVSRGYAWEGLNMLPASIGRVIQFLSFRSKGTSRVLALVDKGNGQSKGLCELTQEEGNDVDAEGNNVEIPQFLLTRRLSAAGPFEATTFSTLRLFLDDVRSNVVAKVFVRSNKKRSWKLHKEISVEVVNNRGEPVVCSEGADDGYDLGKPFTDQKDVRWVQILVRFTGITSIDLAIEASDPQSLTSGNSASCVKAEADPVCDFDPFADAL